MFYNIVLIAVRQEVIIDNSVVVHGIEPVIKCDL